MLYVLLGLLMALVGLVIALSVANVAVYALLWDIPWLRLFSVRHDVEVFRDIPYVPESDDRKHRLDLYRPRHKKHFPTVIFLHGGWWTSGDKDYFGAFTGLYGNIGSALAKRGIGVVIPNYRLAPGVPFAGMIADATKAVRWTQKRIADYDGNQHALFLAGHDAGGQMTALLAADKRLLRDANVDLNDIRGYVPMSAVYDLEDMVANTDPVFDNNNTRAAFGRAPHSLSRWSPSMHLRLGTPPLLMLTAENDLDYLQKQARTVKKKLEELHSHPKAAVIRGYSHIDMVLKFGHKEDAVIKHLLAFIAEQTVS
jgi:acetyl esterase/lipase